MMRIELNDGRHDTCRILWLVGRYLDSGVNIDSFSVQIQQWAEMSMLMLILSLDTERLDGFCAINDFRCIDGYFDMIVMLGWLWRAPHCCRTFENKLYES
jgi:hypothetical protein